MKDPLSQTKVVVRHLPPALSEESFVQVVEKDFGATFNWFRFFPGKINSKRAVYARAYFNFKKPEDVFAFADAFQGHVFVDERGAPFRALVEYAPDQRVPKQRSRKDAKEGTIFQDEDYLQFVAALETPVENLPSAEIQLERLEKEKAALGPAKEPIVVTPLMEFVRQKRANKLGGLSGGRPVHIMAGKGSSGMGLSPMRGGPHPASLAATLAASGPQQAQAQALQSGQHSSGQGSSTHNRRQQPLDVARGEGEKGPKEDSHKGGPDAPSGSTSSREKKFAGRDSPSQSSRASRDSSGVTGGAASEGRLAKGAFDGSAGSVSPLFSSAAPSTTTGGPTTAAAAAAARAAAAAALAGHATPSPSAPPEFGIPASAVASSSGSHAPAESPSAPPGLPSASPGLGPVIAKRGEPLQQSVGRSRGKLQQAQQQQDRTKRGGGATLRNSVLANDSMSGGGVSLGEDDDEALTRGDLEANGLVAASAVRSDSSEEASGGTGVLLQQQQSGRRGTGGGGGRREVQQQVQQQRRSRPAQTGIGKESALVMETANSHNGNAASDSGVGTGAALRKPATAGGSQGRDVSAKPKPPAPNARPLTNPQSPISAHASRSGIATTSNAPSGPTSHLPDGQANDASSSSRVEGSSITSTPGDSAEKNEEGVQASLLGASASAQGEGDSATREASESGVSGSTTASSERESRRLRNRERPDRPVWTPRRRAEAGAVTAPSSAAAPASAAEESAASAALEKGPRVTIKARAPVVSGATPVTDGVRFATKSGGLSLAGSSPAALSARQGSVITPNGAGAETTASGGVGLARNQMAAQGSSSAYTGRGGGAQKGGGTQKLEGRGIVNSSTSAGSAAGSSGGGGRGHARGTGRGGSNSSSAHLQRISDQQPRAAEYQNLVPPTATVSSFVPQSDTASDAAQASSSPLSAQSPASTSASLSTEAAPASSTGPLPNSALPAPGASARGAGYAVGGGRFGGGRGGRGGYRGTAGGGRGSATSATATSANPSFSAATGATVSDPLGETRGRGGSGAIPSSIGPGMAENGQNGPKFSGGGPSGVAGFGSNLGEEAVEGQSGENGRRQRPKRRGVDGRGGAVPLSNPQQHQQQQQVQQLTLLPQFPPAPPRDNDERMPGGGSRRGPNGSSPASEKQVWVAVQKNGSGPEP